MQDIKKGGMPIISQLFSYIPLWIIDQAAREYQSDKIYKKLRTKEHLAFMLFGVVGKPESLNGLIRSHPFMAKALVYFGITKLPARSTLAHANRNRKSDVFDRIFLLIVDHYKERLSGSYLNGMNKRITNAYCRLFPKQNVRI